jgi:hypothetical protein
MEDDNRIAYFGFFQASYFVLATFLTQKHTMLKQLTIKCDTGTDVRTEKAIPRPASAFGAAGTNMLTILTFNDL